MNGTPGENERELVLSRFLSGCRDKAGSGSLSDHSPFMFQPAESPRDPGAEARSRAHQSPFPSPHLCPRLQKQVPQPSSASLCLWPVRPLPGLRSPSVGLEMTYPSRPSIPGQALSLRSGWVPFLRGQAAAPEQVLAAAGDFSLGSADWRKV